MTPLAQWPTRRIETVANRVGAAVGDPGPGGAAIGLRELYEAADLTGAVGLVSLDQNAPVPGGAGLCDMPCETGSVR